MLQTFRHRSRAKIGNRLSQIGQYVEVENGFATLVQECLVPRKVSLLTAPLSWH